MSVAGAQHSSEWDHEIGSTCQTVYPNCCCSGGNKAFNCFIAPPHVVEEHAMCFWSTSAGHWRGKTTQQWTALHNLQAQGLPDMCTGQHLQLSTSQLLQTSAGYLPQALPSRPMHTWFSQKLSRVSRQELGTGYKADPSVEILPPEHSPVLSHLIIILVAVWVAHCKWNQQ